VLEEDRLRLDVPSLCSPPLLVFMPLHPLLHLLSHLLLPVPLLGHLPLACHRHGTACRHGCAGDDGDCCTGSSNGYSGGGFFSGSSGDAPSGGGCSGGDSGGGSHGFRAACTAADVCGLKRDAAAPAHAYFRGYVPAFVCVVRGCSPL
jgi:hypothetical protein